MDDLAAWLTQVWDEDVKRFGGHEEDCEYYRVNRPCDCIYGEMLAQIAADRTILALHSGENDEPCQSWAGNWTYAPCTTALALAAPYAARPGFREVWR